MLVLTSLSPLRWCEVGPCTMAAQVLDTPDDGPRVLSLLSASTEIVCRLGMAHALGEAKMEMAHKTAACTIRHPPSATAAAAAAAVTATTRPQLHTWVAPPSLPPPIHPPTYPSWPLAWM